jgi:hypothetical protein
MFQKNFLHNTRRFVFWQRIPKTENPLARRHGAALGGVGEEKRRVLAEAKGLMRAVIKGKLTVDEALGAIAVSPDQRSALMGLAAVNPGAPDMIVQNACGGAMRRGRSATICRPTKTRSSTEVAPSSRPPRQQRPLSAR